MYIGSYGGRWNKLLEVILWYLLLQAVPLPDATYKLTSSIPESIIQNGKLSDLQFEGIQYAVSIKCLKNKNRQTPLSHTLLSRALLPQQ